MVISYQLSVSHGWRVVGAAEMWQLEKGDGLENWRRARNQETDY
jgi:hypothetical protein